MALTRQSRPRAMIFSLFRKDPRAQLVEGLHRRIDDAVREPALYLRLGVPDTPEGRFEALALHLVLVLRALRRLPPPANDVAQDLVDAFFRQLDASLREMGVGDVGVPKRMKRLAQAFFGRAAAYDRALDEGDRDALAIALGRNVLGGDTASGLAAYALAADRKLAGRDLDALLSRGVPFPPPERFAQET